MGALETFGWVFVCLGLAFILPAVVVAFIAVGRGPRDPNADAWILRFDRLFIPGFGLFAFGAVLLAINRVGSG